MRTPVGVLIFIVFMLLLDSYFFQAVKSITNSATPKLRLIVYSFYWGLVILTIIGFILFVYTDPQLMGKRVRTFLFASIIGLFLAKLTGVAFFLADDIRRGVQWAAGKIIRNGSTSIVPESEGITRSAFLSWLGVVAGSSLFGGLVYGFGNKYNYQVKRLQLSFDNLPAAFRGLKIVHISDIHSGSFMDKRAVERGVDKILKENADMILFTGDLVNDRAAEMNDFMDVFEKLKAPMGVYSTLGNHDYGDYVQWPHEGLSKEENLEQLKQVHAKLGWRLLMNEHVVLEKENDRMALLGIENWSAKGRFPKYGKMDMAYAGAKDIPFKILLSHDPSHWEAEVKPVYSDIDLMLSGHTHGMQFGVELPGFKWSPVQYMYRQWAGLYEDNRQKLYVNRGFGFIGYPGRLGILPEITVLELV